MGRTLTADGEELDSTEEIIEVVKQERNKSREKKEKIQSTKKQIREDFEYILSNSEQFKEIVESHAPYFDLEDFPKDLDMVFSKNLKISQADNLKNRVRIGTNNGLLENVKVARKYLVHELIHFLGAEHGRYARNIGYYSRGYDEFTNKVLRDLGYEVPSEKECRNCFED